jgi:hypothetical protein
MKKNLILLAVFAAALIIGSPVFAADNESTGAGTSFTVSDADPTNPHELTFTFSPGVLALYTVDAGEVSTDGSSYPQWYLVSTYHDGGSMFYGTTSSDSSLFKTERDTNEKFADASYPSDRATAESEVDVDGTMATWWEANDWEK